jgi:hypothetical protein
MVGVTAPERTLGDVAIAARSRRAWLIRRLALAFTVAAGEGLLVVLLGSLAGALVAAAAIPPLQFHLLRGYALRRRAARNLSSLVATAQALAAATTIAAAAGATTGFLVSGLLLAGALVLLLAGRPREATSRQLRDLASQPEPHSARARVAA